MASTSRKRAPEVPPPNPQGSPTILVVDDEDMTRETVGYFLEKQGFTVLLASSGPRALDLIKSQSPDLVIMDLRMPGMDGVQTLEMMRMSGIRVPVIVLSASTDLDLAKQTLRLGARVYLTKPVSLRDLKQTVDWYLAAAKSRLAQTFTREAHP
jgi:CheY-like chemotaxis protein